MAAIPPSFSLIHEGMTQRSQASELHGRNVPMLRKYPKDIARGYKIVWSRCIQNQLMNPSINWMARVSNPNSSFGIGLSTYSPAKSSMLFSDFP